MNVTPSIEQVALEAAKYAANEFPALSSWFTYEDELAREWLKDKMFVCTVEYTITRVMKLIGHNAQMQAMAAQRGGGARGIAYVCGSIVGEWTAGHTSVDAELATW